jgi:hypothetical protein
VVCCLLHDVLLLLLLLQQPTECFCTSTQALRALAFRGMLLLHTTIHQRRWHGHP